jgi:hypothetical protein
VDVIARANEKRLKEMSMNSPTLERIFEETGLAARLEARAEARAKVRIAQNLIKDGFDSIKVVNLTGLDLAMVESLDGQDQG